MPALTAIPPLPMTGPPGLPLDTISLRSLQTELDMHNDNFNADRGIAIDGVDDARRARSQVSSLADQAARFNAIQLSRLFMLLGTTSHKWKDDVARQTLMLAEKQGLKQIVIITEEKRKIIDELQRQIYELLQRPAADGVDELRAEIDRHAEAHALHGQRREGHPDRDHH